MTRTLPEGIVTALTALDEDLADWCLEGRNEPLAVHEAVVLERVRRRLPALLGAVVQSAAGGWRPAPRRPWSRVRAAGSPRHRMR